MRKRSRIRWSCSRIVTSRFGRRRASWIDEKGKRHRNPKAMRLKAEQQREAAVWGAGLKPSELVLLMGVRRRGEKLVGEE
jgi:hypothetical protein